MRIFLACSKGLLDKVLVYKAELEGAGHNVFNPLTDIQQIRTTPKDVILSNLKAVEWADEVHVIWDGSSYGTIFDLGTAYALKKPIKVIYVPERMWIFFLKDHQGDYLCPSAVSV